MVGQEVHNFTKFDHLSGHFRRHLCVTFGGTSCGGVLRRLEGLKQGKRMLVGAFMGALVGAFVGSNFAVRVLCACLTGTVLGHV